VIGVALGLGALLAAVLLLARLAVGGGGKSDAELLAAILPAPRPLGLELVGGAAFPGGDRVLRLAPAVAEEPAVPPGAIAEVVLTVPRSRGGAADLLGGDVKAGMEAAGQVAAWERDPQSAGLIEVARGEVEWRGWRAPFVRRRALHAGGGWSEATAVNLTTPARSLVLTVLWTPGTAGSERELETVLAGVALDAGEADPATP
jgi:hypothetical protein